MTYTNITLMTCCLMWTVNCVRSKSESHCLHHMLAVCNCSGQMPSKAFLFFGFFSSDIRPNETLIVYYVSCCVNYISCKCRDEWSCLLRQSLASKVPLYLTADIRLVLSARYPTGHLLFHGHATVLATEALLLLDNACGTV